MNIDNPIILIIDDNSVFRDVVVQTIEFIAPDSICIEAENGKAALENLARIRRGYSRNPGFDHL